MPGQTTAAGNSTQGLDGSQVGYVGPLGPGGQNGGRRGGLKTKTLKRMLKKAGLKTSGKKAALTKRCKKAHLVRGGYLAGMSHLQNAEIAASAIGGRRTRRRRSLFRKFF